MPSRLDSIRGARVLLVEDNEINRQVAMEIMEYEGFKVDIAENGEKAIQILDKNPDSFDLIFMDLHMPIKDGFSATRELRADDRFQELPIVAMTADAIVGVQQQCFDAGMNDYVTKPVNPSELFAALERWIKSGPKKKSCPMLMYRPVWGG